MDVTTLAPLALFAATLAALGASTTLGLKAYAAPAIGRRLRIHALRREVGQLAQAYEPPVEPKRRGGAHCPACGRFARVTSAGEWGVRTRCAVHGIRLRAVKLIGQRERPVVVPMRATTYRPLVALEPPTTTGPIPVMLEAIRPSARPLDWLDIATLPVMRPVRALKAA
jgi:hypothetical protein